MCVLQRLYVVLTLLSAAYSADLSQSGARVLTLPSGDLYPVRYYTGFQRTADASSSTASQGNVSDLEECLGRCVSVNGGVVPAGTPGCNAVDFLVGVADGVDNCFTHYDPGCTIGTTYYTTPTLPVTSTHYKVVHLCDDTRLIQSASPDMSVDTSRLPLNVGLTRVTTPNTAIDCALLCNLKLNCYGADFDALTGCRHFHLPNSHNRPAIGDCLATVPQNGSTTYYIPCNIPPFARIRGGRLRGGIILETTADDFFTCRAHCDADPECIGYSYNTGGEFVGGLAARCGFYRYGVNIFSCLPNHDHTRNTYTISRYSCPDKIHVIKISGAVSLDMSNLPEGVSVTVLPNPDSAAECGELCDLRLTCLAADFSALTGCRHFDAASHDLGDCPPTLSQTGSTTYLLPCNLPPFAGIKEGRVPTTVTAVTITANFLTCRSRCIADSECIGYIYRTSVEGRSYGCSLYKYDVTRSHSILSCQPAIPDRSYVTVFRFPCQYTDRLVQVDSQVSVDQSKLPAGVSVTNKPIGNAADCGLLCNLRATTCVAADYNALTGCRHFDNDTATFGDCLDTFSQPGATTFLSTCVTLPKCASTPCQHGGTCTNVEDHYTCSCLPGYTGQQCQTDINECSPNPCHNGGSCTDKVNAYTCTCPPTFGGRNCQESSGEVVVPGGYCQPAPCENEASCTETADTYVCLCTPGYTNTNCSTDINECSPNPCHNGGSCTDKVNAYTCTCPPTFVGRNCEEISIMDVRPSVGPRSGGTLVTITGTFIHSIDFVTIGDIPCLQKIRTTRSYICQTGELTDVTKLDMFLDVVVHNRNGNTSIPSGFQLKYQADPVIMKIEPLESIESGGALLTVTGQNFDTLETTLMVTTVTSLITYENYSEETNCTVESSSKMGCPTPKINLQLLSRSRRKRRQAKTSLNARENIEVEISFKLDGVQEYRNLSLGDLREFSRITIYTDPMVQPFSPPVLKFVTSWPVQQHQLEIKGETFLTGLTPEAYTVWVGEGLCSNVEVGDNTITCEPPAKRPLVSTSDYVGDNRIPVKLYFASQVAIVGYLEYIQSLWEYSPGRYGIIGALGGLALIVIIIIAYCRYRRSHRGARGGHGTQEDPGGRHGTPHEDLKLTEGVRRWSRRSHKRFSSFVPTGRRLQAGYPDSASKGGMGYGHPTHGYENWDSY